MEKREPSELPLSDSLVPVYYFLNSIFLQIRSILLEYLIYCKSWVS